MISGKALFIYTHKSSFIKSDIDILSEKYTIREYSIKNNSQLILALSLIKLLLFLVFNTRNYKIIYIWFADYHSFLPVLAGKFFKIRTILVIGGYDVCREKKYKYGSFVNSARGFMALYSMKNASISLAVSENIERIVKKIAPDSNCKLLYNGATIFENIKSELKASAQNSGNVLCVSLVNTEQSFYIKGIDRFIDAAKILSDTQFTLVGANRDFIHSITTDLPVNLQIIDRVDQPELVNYYSKAKVYCQFSRRESFCLALAEAMMLNCYPVISNVGGMPEVVGDTGIIVSEYSPQSLADAISAALSIESESKIFSERVISKFSYEERKQKLLQILEK